MPGTHPLASAAERALAKADEQGGAGRVRWLPDLHCWTVPSSRPGEPPYQLARTKPVDDVIASGDQRSKQPGGFGWLFLLTCNCPASASGYAACWHKAAVFRWWQANRRVDGDAYATLGAFSPRGSHASNALDPDGVERVKDRAGEVRNTPDADWIGDTCECFPGPVNCQVRECPCNRCWQERSGDLLDGDGRPWTASDPRGRSDAASWDRKAGELQELPW